MYESEILAKEEYAQDEVGKILKEYPSVLLCFEKIPEKCHRKRLATVLSQKTGLSVYHLKEDKSYD